MQFYLFDWFTRSRLPAIIPAFDLIRKRSKVSRKEQNVSQEAKKKASFIELKMDEKSRFGKLSTEEIQEIMDKAAPETTNSAVICFAFDFSFNCSHGGARIT